MCLIKYEYKRIKIYRTLFIKKDIIFLLVLIYVDDIIVGSTNEKPCKEFLDLMSMGYEMNMMSEVTFILVLLIKQSKTQNFINLGKYVKRFFTKI